jgi:hypothetical protein
LYPTTDTTDELFQNAATLCPVVAAPRKIYVGLGFANTIASYTKP